MSKRSKGSVEGRQLFEKILSHPQGLHLIPYFATAKKGGIC
jgi:hypothetical protein